jgi:mannose-1-phosphate guanylyltransferase
VLTQAVSHLAIIRNTVSKLHNAILLSGITISKQKVEEYVLLGFPTDHPVAQTLKAEETLNYVAHKLSEPCQKITKFLINSIQKTGYHLQKPFGWKYTP